MYIMDLQTIEKLMYRRTDKCTHLAKYVKKLIKNLATTFLTAIN